MQLDDDGLSPLLLALQSQNDSIASTLVDHQADVNGKTGAGLRLLHSAISHRDSFAALFLIRQKADVNYATEETLLTPLHFAADSNLCDVIQPLVDRGGNLNAQDANGNTPIQRAILAAHIDAVQMFLSMEAVDVNTRNSDGHTALWLALALPTQDVARALVVGRGCDINITTASGDSMLHAAIRDQHNSSALFLIECVALLIILTALLPPVVLFCCPHLALDDDVNRVITWF
jgi:ankyrin repeat protein